MGEKTDPAEYEAWYHTPRGRWIGNQEFSLIMDLMRPVHGQTLLDVGCGTGYFSRRFSETGLDVTGIDPDPAMIHYARTQMGEVRYLESCAEQLPFEDNSFDYTAAVTSLCFVTEPLIALADMWRVSRHGVVLGLLNRNSLLYRKKHDTGGGYQGARWDTWPTVRDWIGQLTPQVSEYKYKTAILLPNGGMLARLTEHLFADTLPWGGFLAVYIAKRD